MQEVKWLKQGAEAQLYVDEYLGQPCLVKDRQPKTYRVKELDEKIRRERTKQECILLHRAKLAGVRTPLVFKVDRQGKRVFMEFVEGPRLKDALTAKNTGWCERLGKTAGKLHAAGIVHGDLTTSNVLLHNKAELVLLDFGLGYFSKRVEDQAVDLLVFKKTFEATHFDLPQGWKAVCQGYAEACGQGAAERVFRQMEEIGERARYH